MSVYGCKGLNFFLNVRSADSVCPAGTSLNEFIVVVSGWMRNSSGGKPGQKPSLAGKLEGAVKALLLWRQPLNTIAALLGGFLFYYLCKSARFTVSVPTMFHCNISSS